MPDEPASTPTTPGTSPHSSQPAESPTPQPSPPAQPGERPGGITILAILYGVYGAVVLLIGLIALFASSAIIGSSYRHILVPAIFAGFFGIVGVLFVLMGIILLIVTWGLWNLKEWAWLIAVVFSVLGLLHFPIGTIINIFVLWYLFKAEVKTAFKRS